MDMLSYQLAIATTKKQNKTKNTFNYLKKLKPCHIHGFLLGFFRIYKIKIKRKYLPKFYDIALLPNKTYVY